ncbi:MAG TPA: hypothetical protein VGB26_04070 [Nitrospiria bacterium]|jgi:hypothetical protein
MGHELQRLKRRKKTLNHLDELSSREDHVLCVHYSCESFYDRPEGKTPRITSVAVRNYSSGQTASFSIHKIAELQKVKFGDIQNNYDDLEKEMLQEYFDFMKAHKTHDWVHWNMRDINYGFAAIEHRFRVLGGVPEELEESRKFDLRRALVSLYGTGYIGHPRLENLIKKNKITDLNFLTGKEESEAFDNKEYVKLHQSTLKKVDILANILGRIMDNSLKTNAKWSEIHGFQPKVIGEFIKEHWFFSILGFVGLVIGIVTGVMSLF